jgi:hypothetical protein
MKQKVAFNYYTLHATARPFFGNRTLSIMTFSITINNMERSAYNDIQHDGRVLLCLVLLCWMSHIIHLYWVSLCWMSLCWVSWRHFIIISCGKISQLIKKMSISKCLSRKQHFHPFKRQWNVVFSVGESPWRGCEV